MPTLELKPTLKPVQCCNTARAQFEQHSALRGIVLRKQERISGITHFVWP
jgi:hypothetical protein